MIIKLFFSSLKLLLLIIGLFFVFTFISSPSAQAAPDFKCYKTDTSYWTGAISMPSSVPTWIKGCFQRITINQGWTGTVSFMYLSPETNDLSSGDKTATLNAVYYYRGTAGVNYAGMCLAVTSTNNSDGRTDIMSIPSIWPGWSVPCSGWLGHNQSNLTSSTVTLYASKFNAGSNKTATFNYRAATDFANDNSSTPNKSGLWCYDFANVVPAPTTSPPDPPWKKPACIADGANYTFVNIIKTPPKGTLKIIKEPQNSATLTNLNGVALNSAGNQMFSTGDNKTAQEAHSPGNAYQVRGDPDPGYKITNITCSRGSCSRDGNKVTGVDVDSDQTTEVTIYYEPDIRSNLEEICPKPNTNGTSVTLNGKIKGWVKDAVNGGGSSRVAIYIDSEPGVDPPQNGDEAFNVDANIYRSDPTLGGNYGFEADVPLRFFDGNPHTFRVYVLRKDSGGNWNGFGSPLYQVSGSPRQGVNCGGPRGSLDVANCTLDDSKGKISGWGFDPERPGEDPRLHLYVDSTPLDNDKPTAGKYNNNNIVGTKLRPDVVTFLRNNGYPGVKDNTKYGFEEQFPPELHDGNPHVIRIYLITKSTSNPKIGEAGLSSQVVCEKWFWPWLQTQNGDVTSSGKITGQRINNDLLGSRPVESAEKEAEYLVMSTVGGGGPFCSTNNYILSNQQASLGKNCDNGSGYTDPNLYALLDGGQDKIIRAISKAWDASGAGVAPNNSKCSPYNTVLTNNLDNITIDRSTCKNGEIYKLQKNSISNLKLRSGRITVWVDGDLEINGNIEYFHYPNYGSPEDVPNLAIIVNGQITVAGGVTKIDAALYSTRSINTCREYNTAVGSSETACKNQLTNKGMMVARDTYGFSRVYTDNARTPAERILLTGQTVAYPPPGLDNRFFEDFDNSTRIDAGEFQPRF